MGNLALEDIRLLDLGMFAAGPWGGVHLADLGAQVIKVESASHLDPLRIHARNIYPDKEPGERPWNRSGMINERNRNKLGITLDLSQPEGKETFLRLAAVSDVVLENFSVGVLDRLGLGYPELRQARPDIIVISMASQGLTGPEKNYVSFGNTLEHTSGISSMMGYPGEAPNYSSVALPDSLAGMLAAGLVLSALYHRKRTGQGMHIDMSQREMATASIGQAILDVSMNYRDPQPRGNRHDIKAPHNTFPCSGEDQWIAISVGSDEEWTSLCQVMQRPDLTYHTRFGNRLSRWKHQEELDTIISQWTREQEAYDLTVRLQEVGVPAGKVLAPGETFSDPHFQASGYFQPDFHPEAGSYPMKGQAFRLSRTPAGIRFAAPTVSQHNLFICHHLLGMTSEEVMQLEEHYDTDT